MISNAQQIKSSFKELLEDGLVHSRTELFDYARSSNPDANYSEGMLTGALKTLTDPGTGYKNVGRAQYQKISVEIKENYGENLIHAYTDILKNALQEMDKNIISNPFKVMEMSEEEKKTMKEIEKCIDSIQKLIQIVEK